MNTRAIVEAALDIEDPTKRQVFIQKACGGDTNLLSDVQSLLAKLEVERTQKSTRIDVTSDFSQAPTNDVDRLNALTRAMDADHDEDESSTLDFLQPPVSPGAIGMLGHYEILQVLGRGIWLELMTWGKPNGLVEMDTAAVFLAQNRAAAVKPVGCRRHYKENAHLSGKICSAALTKYPL